jgi:hypothetical protein
MLDRAQPVARPGARSRARRAARDRRHRQRMRDGRTVVGVEIDARVLELLVRLRWLAERDAADRGAVGQAIAAMLQDAARRG